jgi:hypothetical protein
MKYPRRSFGAVTVDERIYAVGGIMSLDLGNKEGEYYDPGGDKWRGLRGEMMTCRARCTLKAIKGSLYCVGGQGPGAHKLSSVERYDVREGKWDKVTTAWMIIGVPLWPCARNPPCIVYPRLVGPHTENLL